MSTPVSGVEPSFGDYLRDLLRGWKILVLITVVTASVALGLSVSQDKVYAANVDILIKRAPSRTTLLSESPPDMGTEIVLARSPRVRSLVAERLGFEPTTSLYRVGDTAVIRLTVEAPTPAQAEAAADVYGTTYVEERKRQTVEPLETTRHQLESRLAAINGADLLEPAQIEQVATLTDAISEAVAQRDPATLRTAISALESAVGSDSPTTTNQVIRGAALQLLIDEIEALEDIARNSGPELVAPADAESDPMRPAPIRNLVVGAAFGLMLSLGVILLRSYFRRPAYNPRTVQGATDLPVLGVIGKPGLLGNRSAGTGSLELQELRSALQLRGVSESLKTLQLCSPRRSTVKADLVADLASAFARADLRVIVLDADLRRSRSQADQSSTANADLERMASTAPILDGVQTLFAGNTDDDPAAFLGSRRFEEQLGKLAALADLVLVVTPPVLECPDALLVGRVVDAGMLVIDTGRTPLDDVVGAVGRFQEVRQSLIGIVMQAAQSGVSLVRPAPLLGSAGTDAAHTNGDHPGVARPASTRTTP